MLMSLGHSNWSQPDFVGACQVAQIRLVLDTRSHPGSRVHPHFNEEALRAWLPDAGINYVLDRRLGGFRDCHADLAEEFDQYGVDIRPYCKRVFPKQVIAAKLPPTDLPAWTNRGLRDYSYFTMLPEFLSGVDDLIVRGRHENVAVLCAEAQWWRCHRSLVADHLVWRGQDIVHVTPRARKTKLPRMVVSLASHSKIIGGRLERYDARIIQSWESHKSHGANV